MREIIRMGDPTSHGGTVIEGSMTDICHGKPIAYMGHQTYCPRCKGSFTIVEGAMIMTFYGHGVALAGMKTACGATLIATQFTDLVEYASGSFKSDNSVSSSQRISKPGIAQCAENSTDESYDLYFHLTNTDGVVMTDWPYSIETASGERIDGRTDNQGKTAKIVSASAETAILHVYEQDVTPIDTRWDC